MTEVHS